MSVFSGLDWTIVIIYLVGNLYLGYLLSKKVSTAEDFYVGRKSTPWWAIGVSVVATYVSALTFMGAPAWSYKEGLSVMAIHLNYPLVIVVVITFFLPFFYNSGVASIYEYQERRFGPKARGLIGTIFLVSQSATSAAILYATSLVIEFITGVPVIYAILIVSVVALIYTSLGGTTAVIWTDVFQSFVLFAGAFIILFGLIEYLPSGLGETMAQLKSAGKLNALDFSAGFDVVTGAWAGIVGMALFHTTVYGSNQMMVQRTLASKNIGDAKKSYLLMGFFAPIIYFLFILMGVLFFVYYEGQVFENDNTIILKFAADYGMPGLMGIIAAAVMAASMSSLSAAFHSLSTISTLDFYQRYFRKEETPEHYLKVTRIFTVFWAVMIVLPAILYSKSGGSILEVLSKVGSFFVGAQLGMYALGFFSKHATEKGLLVGTAVGFAMVAYVYFFTTIAWPWYCLIGAFSNFVVSTIASILIDGRQASWSPFTIKGQKEKFRAEGRAEKDGRWYLVPGKIDKISYLLLAYFVAVIVFLAFFQDFF
ncbi:MAG: sodium/solute symporter [Xanthomonadales bacterium]|jgi:SSS family solute:Na+ symporter|nr:sodium/solute symporter [Xanthomonadales bacterium]